MIPHNEHAAATILSLARNEPFWRCFLARQTLVRIMYYPEVRYALYLQAVQQVHPFYGGDPVLFTQLQKAKQLLDLREVMPEDDTAAYSPDKTSMSPA